MVHGGETCSTVAEFRGDDNEIRTIRLLTVIITIAMRARTQRVGNFTEQGRNQKVAMIAWASDHSRAGHFGGDLECGL
jgi:hypothetical protein